MNKGVCARTHTRVYRFLSVAWYGVRGSDRECAVHAPCPIRMDALDASCKDSHSK